MNFLFYIKWGVTKFNKYCEYTGWAVSSHHFCVNKNEQSLDGISLSRMLLFICPLIASFSTLERWLSKFYCAEKTNLIRHHLVWLGEPSLALCTSVCVCVCYLVYLDTDRHDLNTSFSWLFYPSLHLGEDVKIYPSHESGDPAACARIPENLVFFVYTRAWTKNFLLPSPEDCDLAWATFVVIVSYNGYWSLSVTVNFISD